MTFDKPNIDNDLRAAISLIRAGEFSRAITYLDRIRGKYGDDPRITDLYMQVYKEGKLYPELEGAIKKELIKHPRDPLLLSELGEARYLQNKETDADSLWNMAIESGRLDESTYRYVADYKLRYGMYDSAIEVYLRGRKNLNSPYIFSMELAGIYEAQRDYPRAIDEYLLQILQMPERLGSISTQIRGLMEDADDPEQIIGTITSHLKSSPGRTELYEILGDLYIKQNKMDKALECYKTIGSKQNDDGQSLVRFAVRALDSKAYDTAILAADEYLKTSKKGMLRETALSAKAKAQFSSGLHYESLAGYRKLFETASDPKIRDDAGFNCGLIFANYKSDCDSAIIFWNILLSSVKDPIVQNSARLEMATCYLKKDQSPLAESLLNLIVSGRTIDSNLERAKFFLGDLYFFRGDNQKASELFKEVVGRFPQGDYSNDALTRLDVISQASDDESSKKYLSLFAQGMKALELNEPLQAASILSDNIFGGSPIAEQASFYAASSLARGKSKADAIAGFNKYIENYSDGLYTDRAYLNLGNLYMEDPATYPQAKTAFNKILEAFPTSPVTELARQKLLQLQSPGKIG
jgi:tetratricopeptide (TPR) repeat protein